MFLEHHIANKEWDNDLKYLSDELLYICETCNGTGLSGVTKSFDGDVTWSGDYCDKCEGKGKWDWLYPIFKK